MQYCSKNKKAGLYNYKPPNNNVLQYLDVELLVLGRIYYFISKIRPVERR